jgi:hypothetical protein
MNGTPALSVMAGHRAGHPSQHLPRAQSSRIRALNRRHSLLDLQQHIGKDLAYTNFGLLAARSKTLALCIA